jgi:hypothetical protein
MTPPIPAWRRFTLLAALVAIGLLYVAAFALFRARSADFVAVRLDADARDRARVPAPALPHTLVFGADRPANLLLGDGWWPADDGGVWSRKERARLFVRAPRAGAECWLTLEGEAFVAGAGGRQRVRLYADGALLGEWLAHRDDTTVRETVLLPGPAQLDGVVALSIEVDRADSPFRTSDSPDNRRLGFHLRLVELHGRR